MNFFAGEFGSNGFRLADGTTLPLPRAANGHTGARAVYGIRPEHLYLDPDGVPATIHVVEPTGSETQVLVHIGDAPVLCALRERITEGPGDIIRIAPDPALVHLFDAASGSRLT